ncbi:hypothetical protein FN846DRAFT_910504 [Sphaerosporella brunnea]|uniref:Uncharacterized protein n=1 Tax=Sphaerosporella brunnea TaxID=1250544 RepID=A0A5J5EMW0_9PEZI|nr:hypothetical protein FN846DRAFT_910504 [Sphaerosporella brunnea]
MLERSCRSREFSRVLGCLANVQAAMIDAATVVSGGGGIARDIKVSHTGGHELGSGHPERVESRMAPETLQAILTLRARWNEGVLGLIQSLPVHRDAVEAEDER